jgi:hypothetical protein
MLEVLIGLLLGSAIGLIAARRMFRPKALGVIRVDNSDPTEPPYLFLELDPQAQVEDIGKHEYVVFQVLVKNYISQK